MSICRPIWEQMWWSECKLHGRNLMLKICGSLVGSDEAVLETFAAASMAGLRHKARHNDRRQLSQIPKLSETGQALGCKTAEGLSLLCAMRERHRSHPSCLLINPSSQKECLEPKRLRSLPPSFGVARA